MKLRNNLLKVIIVAMLIISMTACSKTAEPTSSDASTNQTADKQSDATSDDQTDASANTASDNQNAGSDNKEFTPFAVTDMGGREVSFDAPVEKAYASNLIGILFIRTLNIDKLGGWTNTLSDSEKKYVPEKYQDLPMLGGWSSANPSANIEELVKADIDVIFVTAIVNPKIISMADNIQSQTGIPTVIVSSDINKFEDAYKLMGKVLNEEDRAATLGAYCTAELAEVKEAVKDIPDSKKVRFYYSEGDEGLETDPSGSMHTQAFDFVNAINVADISENTANGIVGQSLVSLEQIIQWNPDYIIRNTTYTEANPNGGAEAIMNNPDWSGINAVKDKNVYQTPALPNNWIDRGPTVNRVIGVKWLAKLFYPDRVTFDVRQDAKEFFSLFYNLDLTDEDLDKILNE